MKKIFLTAIGLMFAGAMLLSMQVAAQITTFPYTEGFENGGALPADWTQQQINGTADWTFVSANTGTPNTVHGGSYKAHFYSSSRGYTTKLITPQLDISGVTNPQLNFWHTQQNWSGDQDILRVYYRSSASGTWTLLQTYSSNITNWTEESILLPNKSDDYYIAFEGNAQYGFGIQLDDVTVNVSNCPDNDAGVSAIVSPTQGGLAAAQVTATLKNFGTLPITAMTVNYQLNNNAPVNQSYSGNMAHLASENFSFTQTVDLSAVGSYTLKVWTELPGDTNHANDTARVTLVTSIDGGVTAIVSPTWGGSNTAQITATLKNFGTKPITAMTVNYQLNNNAPVNQSYSGNMAHLASENFSFTQTVDLSTVGSYTLKVWTELPGDTNHANDTARVTLINPFCGGTGTPTDPYLINSAQTLAQLASIVNAGNNYLGKHIRLTADIDLSTYTSNGGWIPLGTSGKPFCGSFHGGGHSISNLSISRSTAQEQGLFGQVYGSTIDSLLLLNINITGNHHTGAIVGRAGRGTTITACYSSGKVQGANSVGGIAGRCDTVTIADCYSTAYAVGAEDVGGIAGAFNQSTLQKCYAMSKVQGTSKLGGLLGNSSTGSTASYSYFNSIVSGQSSGVGLGSADGVANKTEQELMLQSTFDGWDFTTQWNIWENNSYPYFRWQSTPVNISSVNETKITGTYNTAAKPDTVYVYLNGELVGIVRANSIADGQWNYTFPLSAKHSDMVMVYAVQNGKVPSYAASKTVEIAPFCDGSGTAVNPYQICDAASLAKLSELLNKGIAFDNTYFILTADTDLSAYATGEGWIPIGTSTYPFKGHFYGNGHSITNLTINRSADYQGLFGYLSGGSVSKLSVERVNIKGAGNLGAIVGYATNNARMDSCYSSGKIQGTSSNVAGIVGRLYSGLVNVCYSSVNISGTSYDYAGVAGYPYSPSVVSNCYATGSIINNSSYAGGVVSDNGSCAKNCVAINESIIKSSSSNGRVAGGSSNPVNCSAYQDMLVNGATVSAGGTNGSNATMDTLRTAIFYAGTMGWDMTSTWAIWEGKSHPYFRWQSAPVAEVKTEIGKVSGICQTATNKVEVYSTAWTLLATATPSAQAWTANIANKDTVFIVAYEPGKAASYHIKAVFPSRNTNLQSLTVTNLANMNQLLDVTSPSQIGYSISVANIVTSTVMQATAKHSAAQLRYDTLGMGNLQVGEHTFSVTVVAEDTTAKQTYSVKIKRQAASETLSNDSTLSSITVNGTGIAGFHKDTLGYTVNVPYTTTSLTLKATAGCEYAVITGAAGSITLNIGTNNKTITVVAENGTSMRTYQLNIVRAAASTNNKLSSVILTPNIAITPAFHPDSVSYKAVVPFSVTQMMISGTPVDTTATCAAKTQALSMGISTVTLTVIAQSGAIKNYIFTVIREVFYPLDRLALNPADTTLNVGQTFAIAPVFTPANATNKQLAWLSSNTAVATVDTNGKVTAVSVGTTKVVAASTENGLTDTCTVVVKYNQSISWTQNLTATVGNAPVTLTAAASSGLPITYTSSNESTATVSGNILTIAGVGTTVITAQQAGNDNYNPAANVQKTLVVIASSIKESKTYPVSVYPNPVTNGQLTINNENLIINNGTSIEFFDLNGKLAGTFTLTGEKTDINIGHLPTGTYFVKVGNAVTTIVVVNN